MKHLNTFFNSTDSNYYKLILEQLLENSNVKKINTNIFISNHCEIYLISPYILIHDINDQFDILITPSKFKLNFKIVVINKSFKQHKIIKFNINFTNISLYLNIKTYINNLSN
jgi:hypothetical protein